MDFAGAPIGNFVRFYPAVKRVMAIVDIRIWSTASLSLQMKGVEFCKHEPVSKGR